MRIQGPVCHALIYRLAVLFLYYLDGISHNNNLESNADFRFKYS